MLQVPTSLPPDFEVVPGWQGKHVEERECAHLSCADFFRDFLRCSVPVLIHGHLAAEEWRAMDYFRDLRALYTDYGDSTLIPVTLVFLASSILSLASPPPPPQLHHSHITSFTFIAASLRFNHALPLLQVNLGSPLVGYKGVVHWPLGKLIAERLLQSNATQGLHKHSDCSNGPQEADEECLCEVAYMSQVRPRAARQHLHTTNAAMHFANSFIG